MKAGVALLLLGLTQSLLAFGVEAQSMMTGGRDLRGGREAMTERLAGLSPELTAFAENHRQGSAESSYGQSATITTGFARYGSGAAAVAEWVSRLAYTLRTPGMAIRVSGGPLRFESGDTLSISGLAPINAELQMALGRSDSVTISVRAPSLPRALTDSQVSALGSVGTSAIDLASIQFGTPTALAGRVVHVQRAGATLQVWTEVGTDFEPRPGGAGSTYWRGVTLRGGVGVVSMNGPLGWGGALLVTRSFSDSLGGRNLYYGGGTVLAKAHAVALLGGTSDLLVGLAGSYFHPYSVTESDAQGRQLPIGDFAGGSLILSWPVGPAFFTPGVVVSHESSEASTLTGKVLGSGWSMSTLLRADIPLTDRLALAPQAGYTTGSVRLDVLTVLGTTPTGDPVFDTRGTRDGLSGWWLEAEWRLSF